MKLVFPIWWRNYYRLLGPVIDRALARGWDVECWHAASEDRKSRRRLRPEPPPTFRSGAPRLRDYADHAGLRQLLEQVRPDAVVSLRPPDAETARAARWIGLQYTLDIGHFVDAEGRTTFDAIGVHTEHWRDRAADAWRIIEFNRARAQGAAPRTVDGRAVDATMRRCASVVGFPEMDEYHQVDPADVRKRLGLDPARPVVVYCPFPFRSNPSTFWTRHVYGARWGRLEQRWAAWRRADYAPHVAGGWDDRGVVKAVRAFCDANGAALVVKVRDKEHGLGLRGFLRPAVPGHLRRAADCIVDDHGTHYPPAILELMKTASLCLHAFSTVAYEAAYAGVPSICVTADGDDLGFAPIWREWFLSDAPGTSFNFRGVTYPVSVAEMVGDFARRRLADFPLEPAARAQYLEKFVGSDDGKASDRLLDVASARVEAAR
jgi:hypothetical protein